MGIDLLSKETSNYPFQKEILYGILYGFIDLFFSYNDKSTLKKKCKKLETFLKYLSNDEIKKKH